MKFKIKNLDCPNCARELEEELSNIDGVDNVRVDFINQIVSFNYDNSDVIDIVKDKINNFEEVKVVEETVENKSYKKGIIKIVLSIVLFVISIVFSSVFEMEYFDVSLLSNGNALPYLIMVISAAICYIVIGYNIAISAFKNVKKNNFLDENFLMFIASIGAIVLGEITEGIMVLLLYEIGELLQSIAVDSSRKNIKDLLDLKVDTITKVNGLLQSTVNVEDLKVDDIILIKKGERVPVDVVLVDGSTSFDTKALTGEALYKDISLGEEVLSGYINVGNVVKGKVLRKYQDSAIKKILDLVENSSQNKSQNEKFITKFAKYYTPIVCSLSLVIALFVPFVISLIDGNWGENYSSWIYKALILLVISCPCALIISVPLTYFNGVGVSSKNGILLKGTVYLDELNKIDTLCLDKTGTLTKGEFEIVNVIGEDKEMIVSISASLEQNSTHPLSKAFSNISTNIIFDEFEELSGKGLKGKIDNDLYLLGGEKLLIEQNIDYKIYPSTNTILYLVKNNKIIGIIELKDMIKNDVDKALLDLKKEGIKNIILLTGDKQERGDELKKQISIDAVYGNLLPQDKLAICKKIKEEGNVAFVGDGINDAPSLMEADIGISMGKLGSEIAIEASDIILIQDKISDLVFVKKVSKKTRRIVIENIAFSIACKVIFMILGIVNLIPLSFAVFADVGVMLIAICNSLRLRLLKK